MSPPLVVIGAGGFGREAFDVLAAINEYFARPVFQPLGVLDDQPTTDNLQRLADRQIRYLGPTVDWLKRGTRAQFVVAVGNPGTRRRLAERFTASGLQPATLVHPSASLGSRTTVGDGVVICAGAVVSTNVHLGHHVHLNPNCTVGHDTVVGDFVSVNPGAIISGECRVETEALVGAGATVLQQLTVGARSTVGAAACVVRDVRRDAVVKGVPAR